jgi:hypothetical protein
LAALAKTTTDTFAMNQSPMKTQQCGWLEQNGYTPKPIWLTKSGNESIPDAEIGWTFDANGVHDQQLMLGQNGFGDDGPQTSRLSKANNRCHEMDVKTEQIVRILTIIHPGVLTIIHPPLGRPFSSF